MRRGFFILALLITSSTVFSKPSASYLAKLRAEYLTALSDYLNAPKVYESFLKVEHPDGKTLAYQGALEAIMTKTTWNVFKKMSYLDRSESSFLKALEIAPDDIEIRFMRLAVQFEIPVYLGFSHAMQGDKEFILKNMKNIRSENIPTALMNQIVGFIYRCNMFTEEQIEKIKLILATT